MKQISSKTVQVLCVGCLSLAIAASPSTQGTKAFTALDSLDSSYSVNTLSISNRQITNDPQPTHSFEAISDLVLGTGVVLGIVLLLIALSKSNSRQASNSDRLARPSSRNNFTSLDTWNTMQATNNLNNSSTSSDCSSSNSNADCGNTSWSGGGDCGAGSSWGGDCGGSSWSGGGDCGGSSWGGGC